MVVPIIEGIQKNVMAIAKHYINNNQETHRSGVNEVVDEVTRMELSGPPFSAAVQKAAGVMCSYNRINGDWACENEETLKTMLNHLLTAKQLLSLINGYLIVVTVLLNYNLELENQVIY